MEEYDTFYLFYPKNSREFLNKLNYDENEKKT